MLNQVNQCTEWDSFKSVSEKPPPPRCIFSNWSLLVRDVSVCHTQVGKGHNHLSLAAMNALML